MRTGPQFSSGGPESPASAQVEYRLLRDGTIREFRRGRLSRLDICDAQPELLRVARNLGRPTETDCPICEGQKLVNVAFAFGPRLPASGRALTSATEMYSLAREMDEVAFYVVEVCVDC